MKWTYRAKLVYPSFKNQGLFGIEAHLSRQKRSWAKVYRDMLLRFPVGPKKNIIVTDLLRYVEHNIMYKNKPDTFSPYVTQSLTILNEALEYTKMLQ